MDMHHIRPPAVAGTFYPGDHIRLQQMVTGFLEMAAPPAPSLPAPKALIVPHAGFIYSGPIAASAYVTLTVPAAISRVILIGPAHTLFIRGLAAPSSDAFATPLGEVPIDREMLQQVLRLPQVTIRDAAHVKEHCLEVQLPFLQAQCGTAFHLVPLVVGEATPEDVAHVLDILWGGSETMIIISSDLSHYYSYAQARQLDKATARAIEDLQPEAITQEGACGHIPIQGLLRKSREQGLRAHTLDLRNSGDTAGSRDRVVGYGAWAFA